MTGVKPSEAKFGIDRQSIEQEAMQHGSSEVWLERVDTSYKVEESVDELADKLDELFSQFGTTPGAWKRNYIGARDTVFDTACYSYLELQQLPKEIRLGKFVMDAAENLLDLENEESGFMTAQWFFWLDEAHILEIQAEGAHWSSRFYRHPATGELVDVDHEELYEIETEYEVELELEDSEAGLHVNFEAIIKNTSNETTQSSV